MDANLKESLQKLITNYDTKHGEGGSHDGRYYTKSEIDTKMSNVSVSAATSSKLGTVYLKSTKSTANTSTSTYSTEYINRYIQEKEDDVKLKDSGLHIGKILSSEDTTTGNADYGANNIVIGGWSYTKGRGNLNIGVINGDGLNYNNNYITGNNNILSGYNCALIGDHNLAIGSAINFDRRANEFCGFIGAGLNAVYDDILTIGAYNSAEYGRQDITIPWEDEYSSKGYIPTLFMIGNGYGNKHKTTAQSTRYYTSDNAFSIRANGNVRSDGAYSSTGADYAEMIEWFDKNEQKEDRVGLFVTLQGNQIKIANSGDYIVGLISGNPSILGNDGMKWDGKFLKDDFGRPILQTDIIKGEDGEPTERTYMVRNELYDPELQYIPRSDRPEWAAVGMLGFLRVYDDGTCVQDGYCKVADGGTATAATVEDYSFLSPIFRVTKRVSDNVIEIFFK